MRTTQFALGELYHIYNRGVDKRSLFADPLDFHRFVFAMRLLNQVDLVESIYEFLRYDPDGVKAIPTISSSPLVRIHTYCINQNHFHFMLEPLVDGGVQKYMHRLGTAYTNFFNKRHDRSGSLFQGPYKAIHVDTPEYCSHLGAYITLNNLVHLSLNEPWLELQAFSALGEYGGRDASNDLAYTKFLLREYKTKDSFLKDAHRIIQQVVELREKLKSYKRLCID